ncbi:hypothetical protein AN189_09385 [Loktanella sp. 3ANDIMAR09]|uniref:hypothetical protein n=1 Tax=Loktanella sp. 3ANDIMAR09 TaxID=1225657 RepID=UPI0006FFE353|nr:hypothetical protein [Loktanella sp. 3ANDIMAR09]KQI68517.1 hypothetical protein AN189_09385 [Loktanella sp. 3ANDIMAR09]
MMNRIIIVGALAAVAACSPGIPRLGNNMPADPMDRVAPPPTIEQPALLTAKERLVQGIEANGCELTTANAGAVLNDATISQAELGSLIPQLESEGRVEVSGDSSIRVVSDRCI